MKRSDFGGQRSFAFTTFRLVLFQIGTRLSHRGWGGQAAVPVSPQGQPADIGEARNRPGLLAHGGGWAHFSWLTWLARRRRPRARLEHMSSVDETPGSPLSINHLMLTLQRGGKAANDAFVRENKNEGDHKVLEDAIMIMAALRIREKQPIFSYPKRYETDP